MNRTIDDRLLMDLANQIGLGTGNSSSTISESDPQAQAKAMADAMKGKSESEILEEILKVKSVLQKNPAAYEKQIRAVKSLRGMMNPEQRHRLDQLLNLLEH